MHSKCTGHNGCMITLGQSAITTLQLVSQGYNYTQYYLSFHQIVWGHSTTGFVLLQGCYCPSYMFWHFDLCFVLCFTPKIAFHCIQPWQRLFAMNNNPDLFSATIEFFLLDFANLIGVTEFSLRCTWSKTSAALSHVGIVVMYDNVFMATALSWNSRVLLHSKTQSYTYMHLSRH